MNPIATILMEDNSEIVIELYPDIAYNTVCNFIYLTNLGFFDGLTFHRVVPNFVIQSGDPEANCSGGPGYSIKGEFNSNGHINNLKHTKGIISMARDENKDSAGSQFFIMVGDSSRLDGEYAGFGKVIKGYEVAEKISLVEKDENNFDKPYIDQVIKKIIVDTKSKDYPEPIKIN